MRFLPTKLPLVAAPMAGGATTVELALAASRAGAFPFLAAGYKNVDTMAAEIETLREQVEHFGVNLFALGSSALPPRSLSENERLEEHKQQQRLYEEYRHELAPEAHALGITLDAPYRAEDTDSWAEKLEYLLAHPVPYVSFTFGLPAVEDIRALHERGSRVIATITTVEEALLAHNAGVDALIAQGPRAGGHSATYNSLREIEDKDTLQLLSEILAAVDIPVIAAGGIDSPQTVREHIDAGAEAVAIGTLLLTSDEAGTSGAYRQIFSRDWDSTVMTRAFTGRYARALKNSFVSTYSGHDGYPALHYLTKPLRAAATRAQDWERMHLWAGTGWKNAPYTSAEETIAWLANDLG
ncbi:MAG: nitronate monooxygenase [Rothia sp. (in: high G+C Gram-positive bacteria)]|uniref:NAD(P)H-dependent flavin oxidoreductase n=1 Tax=Rothia sp. (in: high G+C Gram-positive bacteria) TaxID=1885016 RepID=UPI0026DFB18B|nr:nitronate monooxygenase [Rothia sp. (in: high G+C Gram-positive bacteria)]MDO5750059.1 nitronate monooxygenase [Rothia sp. (in: high G+C Gram-positive bacteria)]